MIDAKHISIKGKKYCEYLALDTNIGLIHRYLRQGGECSYGYRAIFAEITKLGYSIKAVVSDGGTGIYSTLKHYNVELHQRCHIHLLRDLKVGLRMNTKHMRKDKRKWFIYSYARLLLGARDIKTREQRLKHWFKTITLMHQPHGQGEINTIKSFSRTINKAFTFLDHASEVSGIPVTTNIVEGYISRLNTRLKTTRGLKSPANAELLINGIHWYLK